MKELQKIFTVKSTITIAAIGLGVYLLMKNRDDKKSLVVSKTTENINTPSDAEMECAQEAENIRMTKEGSELYMKNCIEDKLKK